MTGSMASCQAMKNKRLSFVEIAKIIRARQPLTVGSKGERRDALLAASAINQEITTRVNKSGGYSIIYF